MMNNRTAVNTIGTVILILAAYFIAIRPYIATRADLDYKRLLNDAVTQCMQASVVAGVDGSAPNTEWYQQCIKDKGY